ncbi:hypothetical protein WUBG_00369, partial [Wuchereria bancrofti]
DGIRLIEVKNAIGTVFIYSSKGQFTEQTERSYRSSIILVCLPTDTHIHTYTHTHTHTHIHTCIHIASNHIKY